MRIVKYLFLLIVLAIIAISVYVATQKGSFDITTSTIIDVPRPVVFNYVNDYRNWEDWNQWKKEDPAMTFTYGDNTVGKGGNYSWSGDDSEGSAKTIFVKENDSIAQLVSYAGTESTAYISFKDTLGKTKVTWHTKGRLNFISKIKATFKGGTDKLVYGMYEKSLSNLNQLITMEMKTFDVKVNGISQQPASWYIKQTYRCKQEDLQSRLLLVLPKMMKFFKKHNIVTTGSPFIIYENIDTASGMVTFSICGPVSEQVYFAPGSDMGSGQLPAYTALKTTLTGDYSHRPKARKKAADYLAANNLQPNPAIKKIDVFVKSATDIKNPSKWVTELLMPLTTVSAPVVARPAVTVPAAPASQQTVEVE